MRRAVCIAKKGMNMRRLEKDQRDDEHLTMYAEKAGITTEQAKIVLDTFLGIS